MNSYVTLDVASLHLVIASAKTLRWIPPMSLQVLVLTKGNRFLVLQYAGVANTLILFVCSAPFEHVGMAPAQKHTNRVACLM